MSPDAWNALVNAEWRRIMDAGKTAADKRAELIDDIAECMNERNDLDVGFVELAEAVVEMLEKRGLLRFADAP